MIGKQCFSKLQNVGVIPMRDAKGLTTRLVPMTMSKSAFGKSSFALVKKAPGKFSPAANLSDVNQGTICLCHEK